MYLQVCYGTSSAVIIEGAIGAVLGIGGEEWAGGSVYEGRARIEILHVPQDGLAGQWPQGLGAGPARGQQVTG